MAVAITTAMQNQIAQNYIAILGRNPDSSGFSFWVQTYADANGTPAALTSITNGFGNSAEFRSTYSSLTTSDAIALMYQNVLLRPADAGGLAYWTGIANALIAGGQTISNAYAQTGAQMIYTASANGSSDSAGINARTTTAVSAGNAAPISTYTLTTNIDTFGNAGSAKQVFNAADGTFTSLDNLTGGSNTTDTLNIAQTAAYTANPAGAKVTNIENVNFSLGAGGTITTASDTGFAGVTNLGVTSNGNLASVTAAATTAITVNSASGASAIAINGGTSVNLTVTSATTGANVTVGGTSTTNPTGAVTVSLANSVTSVVGPVVGSTVTITGGSVINVTSTLANTSNANNTATTGAIGVTGTANTTSVTVTQSASATRALEAAGNANVANAVVARNSVVNSAVTIADANAGSLTAAATITAVTLANYGASTISSNALTTLTLSNSTATGAIAAGTLDLTYGLTTGNPTSLALNLGGGSLGVLQDIGNRVATVNVNLTAATTLAGITDTALRTVTLAGTGVLSLTAVNTAITAITNTSTAAGLSADVSGLNGLTNLNFASTSANNTITLNAITQTYTGGSGNDVITITADATKVITGGSGTDTIILGAGTGTFTATNTGANVTGFETVGFNANSNGAYALNTIGLAANATAISVTGANAGGLTVTGLAAGTTTFNINAAQNAPHVFQYAGTAGAATAVTLNLNPATSTTIGYTTAGVSIRDANAVGVGTINVVSTAPVFQGRHILSALNDFATSQLSNLNITGNASLTITGTTTAATALTISDNSTGTSTTTNGITTLTSQAAILGALNYSGTKAFAIGTLTDDVANLTITNANTGTSGVLTIGSGAAHVQNTMVSLNLVGSVAYTGTSSVGTAATVNGATNNSAVSMTFTLANAGIKTVTLGNGANTVVTGTAKDVITVGTGANTITAGADADAVTLGSGHTTVNTLILNAVVGTSTDSTQVVVAGAGNDTGADVYTNVNIATDVFRVVGTGVTGFNGSTGAGTNVGIGTGGTGTTGTLASFTTNTGVVYLGGTTGTFGTGDIAISFTTPTAALTTANFNSMLQYNLTGTAAANVIVGGSRADTLTGGLEADTLTGGAGADTFVMGTDASIVASFKSGNAGDLLAAATQIIFATNAANTVDKITDFTGGAGGDVLDLVAVTQAVTAIGVGAKALVAGTNYFLSGAYVAGTGLFTIAADGAGVDTLIIQGFAGIGTDVITNTSAVVLIGTNSASLTAANFV